MSTTLHAIIICIHIAFVMCLGHPKNDTQLLQLKISIVSNKRYFVFLFFGACFPLSTATEAAIHNVVIFIHASNHSITFNMHLTFILIDSRFLLLVGWFAHRKCGNCHLFSIVKIEPCLFPIDITKSNEVDISYRFGINLTRFSLKESNSQLNGGNKNKP